MKNIWRFYNGKVSGIVIAETEQKAIECANYYLKIQFDDIGKDDEVVSVWRITKDDDFRSDYPFACAVAY